MTQINCEINFPGKFQIEQFRVSRSKGMKASNQKRQLARSSPSNRLRDRLAILVVKRWALCDGGYTWCGCMYFGGKNV